MPWTLRSAEELRDLLLRALNAYAPQVPTGPGTLAALEAAAYARVLGDLHVRLAALDADLTPLTATEAGVLRWAELLGVERLSATGSTGTLALQVTGVATASIPDATALSHRSGLAFETVGAAVVGSGGTVLVSVRAVPNSEGVQPGADSNLAAGEVLKFDVAPTDVRDAARLILDLSGGVDEETIGALRDRVVARFRDGAQGGRRSDYEQWVLEAAPAGSSAYVYASKPTQGSVSLAALRAGTGVTRALSEAERDAIDAYVADLRPVTDNVAVMETIPEVTHVDVQIAVLPSAAFDWVEDQSYTVTSYVAASGELTLSPALPATLAVGDLLTVRSLTPTSSGADGQAARVAAIVDADTVVIAPFGGSSLALSWTPTVGDPVHPYSLTADAVRQAIIAGYDVGCGTDMETTRSGLDTLGPANPSRVYGDWQSDLEIGDIEAAARSVPGVVSVSVVTPSADVLATEYAFPDDDRVGYLNRGQVVVRPA